jgi:hypothetical protein
MNNNYQVTIETDLIAKHWLVHQGDRCFVVDAPSNPPNYQSRAISLIETAQTELDGRRLRRKRLINLMFGRGCQHTLQEFEIRQLIVGWLAQEKLRALRQTKEITAKRWQCLYFCLALGCDMPILEALTRCAPLEMLALSEVHRWRDWLQCDCPICMSALTMGTRNHPYGIAPELHITPWDLRGVEPSDVWLVRHQTGCSLETALTVIHIYEGDIVYAIMGIMGGAV